MYRRTFLASFAALTAGGSAGCTSRAESVSTPPYRKIIAVSNVNRTTPESIDNVSREQQPTELEFRVDVTDETITPDSTAQVALKYTNTGEDTLEVNLNPDHPNPITSDDETPGLVLLSDAYDPTRASDTCWKPTEDGFPVPAVAYQYPIEPGETVTLPYKLWAAPDQEASCITLGDYRFEPLYGSFTITVRRADT